MTRLADVAHLGARCLQELPAHRRVEEQVPHLDARAGRAVPGPTGRQLAAVAGELGAVGSAPAAATAASTWATPPIDARASPRKPSVPMRNRSSAVRELAGGVAGEGERQVVGVRCRSRHRRRGSARCRPARRRCRCGWRRRRRQFSSSSLTTLAGRSMTSPAAILVMTDGGNCRMRRGGGSLFDGDQVGPRSMPGHVRFILAEQKESQEDTKIHKGAQRKARATDTHGSTRIKAEGRAETRGALAGGVGEARHLPRRRKRRATQILCS